MNLAGSFFILERSIKISMKFYAVRKGRRSGIFLTWKECELQVKGYSQAEYKSFACRSAAEEYLKSKDHHKSLTNESLQLLGWKDPEIVFFSDGGSRNHGNRLGDHVHNSDKAAWAFLIQRHGHNLHASGGEYGSTNNRMELMGFINALKVIGQRGWNREKINAVLDSRYVLNAVQKGWIKSWKANGWLKSSGEEIANLELWKEIDRLLPYFPQIRFIWTKGHATNKGNIMVDHLLNYKMDQM